MNKGTHEAQRQTDHNHALAAGSNDADALHPQPPRLIQIAIKPLGHKGNILQMNGINLW